MRGEPRCERAPGAQRASRSLQVWAWVFDSELRTLLAEERTSSESRARDLLAPRAQPADQEPARTSLQASASRRTT
jgi:hypothetical protein